MRVVGEELVYLRFSFHICCLSVLDAHLNETVRSINTRVHKLNDMMPSLLTD